MLNLVGFRIIETPHMTNTVRVRTHRRKRIDKKWRKRYGFKTVANPDVIIYGTTILAHPATAAKLRKAMERANIAERTV